MTMTMKKYADVVRAYLDGAEVQAKIGRGKQNWEDIKEPSFIEGYEYRIKSKIVEKYIPVGFINNTLGTAYRVNGVYEIKEQPYVEGLTTEYPVIAYIKMLCEEDTGKVVSVELVD